MQTAQREVQSAGRGHPANVRLDEARSAVYTTNMATPAANIATVVIATTVHPKRDCSWLSGSFVVWDCGAEASRGERHLEVNYELAAHPRHRQRSLAF
jgi:hypothetical protein